MTNREKYNQTFIDCFSVTEDVLNEEFVYQCIPAWDSVGHMGLIAGIEEAFGIELEMDDVIDFSSYVKGKEILKKYSVEI